MSICAIYARTSIETDGTSIEQQIQLGIEFCKAQGFQYQIYEDAGKSGYKIEDENDPFRHRAGLTNLIADVEKKTVDKIWCFEHSRLSRNQYAWYMLRRIFERNKVEVYENGRLFKLDDPQSQMIQGILTQVAEYERHLITSRTTRGIRATINTGLRSYWKTYGYRQNGKNERFIIWEPVESEIENIKFAYNSFLSGRPINSIVKELHGDEPEPRIKVLYKVYRKILTRFDYTGFSLTTEGAELCDRYKNFESDSLSFLNEMEDGKPRYYVPSINYPVQIVSMESWAAAVERLRENKEIFRNYKRAANSDMFTGIIKCPYCGLYYYSLNDRRNLYQYYSHIPSKKCLQKPKSSRRERINGLAGVFYFYYYLVYEDTNELLKESRTIVDLNIAKIKDRIFSIQSENRETEKQINRLQRVLGDDSSDNDLIKLALSKEIELKIKLDASNESILKLKSELGQLDAEKKKNLRLLTYQKVKGIIISFFEKLGIEEKRKALLKIIKECVLFRNYLLVNTGKMLFVFDIKEDYAIDEKLYNQFKTEEYLKVHFTAQSSYEKSSETYGLDIETSHFLVQESSKIINRYKTKNPEDKKIIKEKLEVKEIDYDLNEIDSVICFTDL